MHPRDRARRAGQLPDLRHGAGADDPDGRRGRATPSCADMTRRFWVGVALSAPLLVMAMARACRRRWLDALTSRAAVWVQLALGDAGRCCGAAGRSSSAAGHRCVNRHLNMFTLIALGTGVAYLYSLVAALVPGIFPASFRGPTAACRSISRRRRSSSRWSCSGRCSNCAPARRPSSAIRALLDLAPKTRPPRRDGRHRGGCRRSTQVHARRPAARPARREGAGRRRRPRRAQRRRRIDDHRRAAAGREGGRRQGDRRARSTRPAAL